jgi:hypothetical protein
MVLLALFAGTRIFVGIKLISFTPTTDQPTVPISAAIATTAAAQQQHQAQSTALAKGGVEGEVGRYRRRWLVPVPKVGSLKELNDLLEDGCFAELERRIAGRDESVREALRAEMRILRPLAVDDFDAAESASPRVNAKALVTVRQETATRCPAGPLPDRRPARPLPRALAAQAGRAQGFAALEAGARALPLAGLLRRALAADRESLRRL